jgi:diaminopimelate epimerase
MNIPFTKAHGAGNDFLLTWENEAPTTNLDRLARQICDRHRGVGADGWMLLSRSTSKQADCAIRLFNSDGSQAEMSGNGTRCAAAFLILHGFAHGNVRIETGAGLKTLRLLERAGRRFRFEMDMGAPEIRGNQWLELSSGLFDCTVLWAGNPQCALFVPDFDFDWRSVGAEIERRPEFPNRTNVSFIRSIDRHRIDVRFWERGAGETQSSGTGSTGAAAAAIHRGLADAPITVMTPAGSLEIHVDASYFLTGPAEITVEGLYFATLP